MLNPISSEHSQRLLDTAIDLTKFYPQDIPLSSIKIDTPSDSPLPHLKLYIASSIEGVANEPAVDMALRLLGGTAIDAAQGELVGDTYSGKIEAYGAIVHASSDVAGRLFFKNYAPRPEDIEVARYISSFIGQLGIPILGVRVPLSKFFSSSVRAAFTTPEERQRLTDIFGGVIEKRDGPDWLDSAWPGLQASYTIKFIGVPSVSLLVSDHTPEANQERVRIYQQMQRDYRGES